MLSKEILIELEQYVLNSLTIVLSEAKMLYSQECNYDDLESFVDNNKTITFAEQLFSYIDEKELTDSEVYKKAGIDRRLFSKIRSKDNYRPRKKTIIALALALNLNENELEHLLGIAGYTLTTSNKFDLVIKFCLENNIYNIYDVNLALDYLNIKPL